ncbi:MAG: peptidase M16 [Sphingopyxis sp.]|nr:peptidase M16 [Sphingopyxis sp.]
MKPTRLLLSAAVAALSLSQPAHADEVLPFEQFTLSNGLRVVVHEDRSTPKVAVAVWYHVGSANEPAGKSGFAHLYEHLMFNGSEHRDDEWFPPLQEIGASAVNGATSFDQTYYYEVVPTGGLERALWMESDRMGHLLGAITQAKLDEQRGVVQNEKRQRESQPYAKMDDVTAQALFPVGHPYYHPIIGSMDDLNAASLADVKDWFGQYYGAANAVLSLSGDVDAKQARALAEKYFGSVPAGPPVSRATAWVPSLSEDKRDTMLDNVPQTAVSWSWAVPGRGTPQASTLRVAANALGSGKTSRLYKALILDRPLATSVSVNYQPMAVAGIFSIDARLKPGVDAKEAEAAIRQTLDAFLATGPTADELKRAKVTNYGNNVRALESVYVRAMALADGMVFANNPAEYAEENKRFDAVTGAAVLSDAKSWLTRGAHKLTVLPYAAHTVTADGADRTKLPELAAASDLTLPVAQEARLSNGIRIVFSPRRKVPTVDMAIVFDAGTAADAADKKGLGGFALQMMGDGPEGLTAQAFEEKQAALGARLFATSGSDRTSFMLSSLSRELPATIALWANYIRTPGFRPDDLERDRTLSLSGISQSLAEPTAIAQRTFTNVLYGAAHPYGAQLAGRAETLQSFTRADVAGWHASWVRPDNAVIYASGDTTLEALTALLEKGFGSWTPPAQAKGSKTVAALPFATASRVVLVDKPGAIQSVIRVGQLLPDGLDPRNFDYDAANGVLGGSFTARLNMNLREDKGWTYGASSFINEQRGPQNFGVATSVQTDKTAEALAEIDKEIRAIRTDRPATQAEVDMMVKGNVLSLPGQFETNQAFVSYLQYVSLYDKPYDYLTTLPAKYGALTPAAVTKAADEMLRPDAMSWVIVGDLSKIEAKVRALSLGPVEVWDAEGRKLR